jgi:hypothetical protein
MPRESLLLPGIILNIIKQHAEIRFNELLKSKCIGGNSFKSVEQDSASLKKVIEMPPCLDFGAINSQSLSHVSVLPW